MKQLLLLITLLVTMSYQSYAQMATLPSVFMIGEHQEEYSLLLSENPAPLLAVCDNKMDDAYEKWTTLLHAIEQEASLSDFNLKGIKVWINVFFNTDGSIKNLAFHPKPNSKEFDYDTLKNLLEVFVANYNIGIANKDGLFVHYGCASFPTLHYNE